MLSPSRASIRSVTASTSTLFELLARACAWLKTAYSSGSQLVGSGEIADEKTRQHGRVLKHIPLLRGKIKCMCHAIVILGVVRQPICQVHNIPWIRATVLERRHVCAPSRNIAVIACWLFARMQHAEDDAGQRTGHQLRDSVNAKRRPTEHAEECNARAHPWD